MYNERRKHTMSEKTMPVTNDLIFISLHTPFHPSYVSAASKAKTDTPISKAHIVAL